MVNFYLKFFLFSKLFCTENVFWPFCLFFDFKKGTESLIKYLIEKGADVNATDKNLRTPLRWSAENGKSLNIS